MATFCLAKKRNVLRARRLAFLASALFLAVCPPLWCADDGKASPAPAASEQPDAQDSPSESEQPRPEQDGESERDAAPEQDAPQNSPQETPAEPEKTAARKPPQELPESERDEQDRRRPAVPLIPKIEDHGLSHVFSLGIGYALSALRNNTVGISPSYEQKLFRFMSLKFGITAGFFEIGSTDIFCIPAGVNIAALYYPFGKGLEWLYLGLEEGIDFLHYFGEGLEREEIDTAYSIISVTPLLGWKQICFRYSMLDFYCGYKLIIQNNRRFDEDSIYTNQGLTFGVKIHIFWRDAFNTIFRRGTRERTD